MDYSIIKKKVNFKNPQLILSNGRGNIGSVDNNIIDNLSNHMNNLDGKDVYNHSDLEEIHKSIKMEMAAKKRVLKQEENKGFITIGSLTIVGFLIIGFIIFTTIGSIIGR